MQCPPPIIARVQRVARALGLCVAGALGAACNAGATDLDRILESTEAQEMLAWGQRYEHGEGVERNADAAVMLYCRAAHKGVPEAFYRLGWMYANGRGVPRDDALAAAWFAPAARKGDAHAQRMLARLGEPAGQRRCLRPDGRVYRGPLRSVANPSRALVAKWVQQLAPEYGLDERLVLAVIRAESNFDARALSSKNAQGLMQLIPATARRFRVDNPWDPLQNIEGGMRYLRWLLDYFEGNEALALAGYNAGEAAVVRYRGVPPYAETRAYVKRVSMLRRNSARAVAGSS